jgi:hypothetical protein
MMEEIRTYFDEALKATDPLPMPKVTPPTEIYDAVKKIGLEDSYMLRAYHQTLLGKRQSVAHHI